MAKFTRTYPQLVVFREKYGDNFYLVESKEAEQKMFLEVLTDRFNQGWYSWFKDYKPYETKPSYTRDDIEKMPNSMESEKKKYLLEISKWERSEKEAQGIRNDYQNIVKAVESKDGSAAEKLIREYSDGEYERFDYENFTHIK